LNKLRLYCLRWGKGGVIVRNIYKDRVFFNDKMEAKNHRLEGVVVSYGPDHKKYKPIKSDL